MAVTPTSGTNMAAAAFDTFDAAAHVVRLLEAAGFSKDEIAIVSNKPYMHEAERLNVSEHVPAGPDDASTDEDQAMVGGAVGGAVGSILASLVFPPLAPFIAAGWLGAALGGAVIGGAAGLVASLVDSGYEDRHAAEYVAAVEAGATLVSVRCAPERLPEAQAILAMTKSSVLPIELAD